MSKIGPIVQSDTSIITTGLVFNMDFSKFSCYPRTGTTITDLKGSLTGTLTNNPTFSSDFGGVFDFDGVDDFIESNYTGNITSLSIWFKPNSTIVTSANGGCLIGFIDGFPFAGIYLGKCTSTISDELITVFATANSNKSFYSQVGGTIDTNWHNLVIAHTGTQYNIYLDSVNVSSGNQGGNVDILNATRFDIGTRIRLSAVSVPFAGKISNILIYNKELSSDEVSINYNALKERFE